MVTGLAVKDGDALFGLLADIAGEIIVKLDRNGFIEHASPGLEGLGLDMRALLIAPHVSDLADPIHAEDVRAYCRAALEGTSQADSIEFPLPLAATEPGEPHTSDFAAGSQSGGAPPQRRWYALRLRRAPGDEDEGGALGILRSIAYRRSLLERLSSSETADPLTGAGNRRAFLQQVQSARATGGTGSICLIEIDGFRALSLRFGPASGDDMVRAFADYLRVMLRGEQSLARIEGSRFAFIMPGLCGEAALAQAGDIVATFAELSLHGGGQDMRVTASAGLAPLAHAPAACLAKAERALILASAAGGMRAETSDSLPAYLARRARRARRA